VIGKRSLIIGAAGQLGTQLRRLLPPDTISTSREPRSGWLSLDLQQLADDPVSAESILANSNIGAVYCAGAMTYVDGCESSGDLAIKTNAVAPAALAAAAANLGAAFVYYSTDYLFDGMAGPYPEDAKPAPINVYGRSKWVGEQAVTKACPSALILRTTGVFGPDERGKNFLYSLKKTLVSGNIMTVPSDQFATPTYNVDLALASIALVRAKQTGVFNVAGPELVSRVELARRAAAIMGLNTELVVGKTTAELGQIASRPLLAGLRIEKLRDVLPEVRMRGIEECVDEWNRSSSRH
jgi:dTDP-4-dehydrorhamnose reductase